MFTKDLGSDVAVLRQTGPLIQVRELNVSRKFVSNIFGMFPEFQIRKVLQLA
jgi:hypothetical protein